MKLTDHQFTEAAFIFEKENGSYHGNYEKSVIKESNLTLIEPSKLKANIIDGLQSNLYAEIKDRTSAYWALSKTNDTNLISDYKKWLKRELSEENPIPIFQILLALDRFDEPSFHKDRVSRHYDDVELNIRDAKNYLENN
ncbi:hypothetical protein [Winogradskyella sp. R77965]|uniref:hypothetical protein n=1 Tax=Winogradskyella sp. R77965 TaxID=3093872 RepID=UPI0037DC5937